MSTTEDAEAPQVRAPAEETTDEPPRRRRRWPRRLGVTVLALAVACTLFSLIYNAATAGRARPPSGLTYVRTGDLLTRYRAWGSGGSPIVLVHGAAESADTWAALATRLARGHRVYALDLDGSGYTSRRGPYASTTRHGSCWPSWTRSGSTGPSWSPTPRAPRSPPRRSCAHRRARAG